MANYNSPIAILFVSVSTTINNVDAKSLLRKRRPTLGIMQQQQQQAKSRQLEVAELSGCEGGCSMSMSLPNLEQSSSQFIPELTIEGDEGLPEGTFPLGQDSVRVIVMMIRNVQMGWRAFNVMIMRWCLDVVVKVNERLIIVMILH